VEINIKK